MSAWSVDTLRFLHQTRTDVWIAEQSGIPRSTVGAVRRGERLLPTQYGKSLSRLRQSEMVRRLDEAGLPHRASFAMSNITPDRFYDVTRQLKELTERVAVGRYIERIRRLDEQGRQYDPEDIWNSALEGAEKSLKQSRMTWSELQERYG